MNEQSIPALSMKYFFTAFLGLTVILNLLNILTDFSVKVFFAVALVVFLLTLCVYLVKILRFPVWVQVAGLFFIAMALRVLWIKNVPTIPFSDFDLMYRASVNWVKGDLSFVRTPYFDRWSYQLGYTWLQAVLVRLFGEGYTGIQIFNCFVSSLTTVVCYFSAKKLFGPGSALFAGLLAAIDVMAIAMCSVLTNQHIAVFLFYTGMYLVIHEKRKTFSCLAAGFVMALGNVMRPLGMVAVSAVVIYVLFFKDNGNRTSSMFSGKKTMTDRMKGFAKTKLLFLIVFLLAYQGTGFAVNRIFMASHVTEAPLGNRDPLWKFVTGLNPKTKGQYSHEDIENLSKTKTLAERRELEISLIKERLSVPVQLPGLFWDKFKIMWVNKNHGLYWSIHPIEDNKGYFSGKVTKETLYSYMQPFDKAVYFAGLLFALIGAILVALEESGLKQQGIQETRETKVLLYMLVIFLYIGAHLLIEIQPRYRMFLLPSFAILASKGLHVFGGLAKDG